MRRCLDASPTVGDGVARMLEEYADLLEGSGFAEGCPVAAVALDLEAEPGALQAACGAAFDGWVALVAEALRGEGRDATEAGRLALTAIAAFEGALLVGRARRDASAVRAVAASARALLNSAA
jgi:transcriptional regulator LmrA/YxaF-like protein